MHASFFLLLLFFFFFFWSKSKSRLKIILYAPTALSLYDRKIEYLFLLIRGHILYLFVYLLIFSALLFLFR